MEPVIHQVRSTLPVWQTLEAVVHILAERWRPLLRALLVPALIITLLNYLSQVATMTAVATIRDSDGSSSVGYMLLGQLFLPLASGLVGAILAVSCHRIVLLGSKALPNRWGIYWSRRELRFFGWVFLIGFSVVLGFATIFQLGTKLIADSGLSNPMMLSAVAILRKSIYFGTIIPVTASIGLVLPATAIGEQSSLRLAWSQVRGNIIRLAILLAIPLFVVAILSELISQIGGYTGAVSSLPIRFAFILLGVFEIIVLSVSYRELVPLGSKQITA